MQGQYRSLVVVVLAVFLSAEGAPVTTYFHGSKLGPVIAQEYADWFSKAKEPVLSQGTNTNYAVRVTVFQGTFVVLRIEKKSDGSVTSVFKHFCFLRTGVPMARSAVERSLASTDFMRLSDAIERLGFFSVEPPDYVVTGTGPMYLVEVYDGAKYHVAERPARETNTPFGTVAELAAEIAGIDYVATLSAPRERCQ
jgi:hypothetical protein